VPTPGPAVSSFNQRRIPAPSPAPVIVPLGVHYYSDGTGRDSYIGVNEGGLAMRTSFTDFKTAFKNSLRSDYPRRFAYVKNGGHSVGLQK